MPISKIKNGSRFTNNMKMNITYLFILSSILMFMNTSCSTQKELVAFKVYSQKDKKIMKVNKNGILSISGKKLGILTAEGVLTNLENDTLAYQDASGIVYSREHKALGKIDKNGAIEIDATTKLVWTADGKLQVTEEKYIRVEPNFQTFYNKTAFLFIVYVSMNSSDEELENVE